MNKRKGKLQELYHKKDNKHVEALFRVLFRYYELCDLDTGTNHGKVFKALYIDGNKTYEQIADECAISVSTVERYVKRYDAMAERLLKNKRLFDFD